MPKSFLDTQTYYPARQILLTEFRLLAVVNCHKNTFQPHTGVRTCLVFIERPAEGDAVPDDYTIFMAISRKVGQDSEGVPIFRFDAQGRKTIDLDHDLDVILRDYSAFRDGVLNESEYRFAVARSLIDENLRINPQVYLPNLNETIRNIERLDSEEGWSVSTLGQITQGVEIFKGPRLKSENLIVEEAARVRESVEPYYTPSAVLQENLDSAKYLDVSKAKRGQVRTIDAIRVHQGDIVITRSGTIGRVAYISSILDGAIVSDDLIRVRIADENLRLFVFAFLQTTAAQHQMARNEYGAVQQHLEPHHIADLLVPIPDDFARIQTIIEETRKLIAAKETLLAARTSAADAADALLEELFRASEKD